MLKDPVHESWRRALAVAGGYVAVAALYIFASSAWLPALDLTPEAQAAVEVAKGLGFVGVTGILLFGLVAQQMRALDRTRKALIASTHDLGKAENRNSAEVVAAAIAHDMKNHLSVAVANAQLLEDAVSGSDEEALVDLRASLDALKSLAGTLMDRAKRDDDELEPVDLGLVARRVAKMVRYCTPLHAGAVTVKVEQGCKVLATERGLEQVILNLLHNALEATDGAGRVELDVRSIGDRVTLTVRDEGPGVPAELTDRVFEPFFTTKRSGNGLGLATVQAVARRFHGDVELRRAPRGACFAVHLPLQQGARPMPAASAQSAQSRQSASTRPPRVPVSQ